jgi:hypothetical protein
MSIKRIIGLILIIGTILAPFVVHFSICLSRIINDLKDNKIPDESDTGFVILYVATVLIGTGIVLVVTG